ncbi:PAS domain-containing protein [Rhodohalobacter sp. SW132]|uniref:histidine kinase dimerization/phosphoacceptor domain -containing protein n=1 Tax=Rhodohalobacter sp. SW132 TaxID=2293433 RepID=UPI000E270679|nr:histidine kinase dimerization/phosphoacceptor domain -containing protein [Rhodohalobacter sp. SW132]REL38551.1 PAS domain-containing protein [Rhodohalobacter sp. SW132]
MQQKNNIKAKKNILLIGDSSSEATGIADKIKHCGYEVVTTNGDENLMNSIKQHLPSIDLIVMDLGLVENRQEAESIMNMMSYFSLPVLFTSGDESRHDETRVDKPVSASIMDNSVELNKLDSSIRKALQFQYNHIHPEQVSSKNSSRYEMVFNNSDDAIFIFDADTGRLLDVNPAVAEFTKVSGQQLSGKKFWEIDLLQQIENEANFLHEIFINGSQWFKNIPVTTPDYHFKQIDVRGSVFLEDGRRRFQYTVRDATPKNRTIKLLEKEIETKEIMIQELQHRTKNSFSLICGLTDLKAMSVETDEARELLEGLSARIQSVAEVYHLLYQDQSSEDVNVHEYCNLIIDSIIGNTDSISVQKDDICELRLELKKASSVGLILVEFLFNAIKYAFPKKKHGEVRVSLKKKGENYLLTVSDNGIGVPHGFEVNQTNCSGLYLAQVMAEQINGSISLESDNGTRATLEFTTE